MNHLYFEEDKVTAFAHALAKTAPFTEGPFLLYRDAPLNTLTCEAPCFRSSRNLETMDAHTARQSVDYLVCKGENPVLGITFDFDTRDSKQVFGTVLRGVSHIAVNSLDFKQEDYDTERLLQHVLAHLEELPPSEYILRIITTPAVRYIPELQSLGLISGYGNATMYGRDCGLFFCCRADKTGAVSELPVLAGKGWHEYMNAINYSPEGSAVMLSDLLDCSIADFFEWHIEQWNELNQVMTDAFEQKFCTAYTPLDTFVDYLVLLNRLSHTESAGQICKRIRDCIMPVICFPGIERRFKILGQTLKEFCKEAARITNSYYPIWLYERQIRPYFNGESGSYLSLPGALHYAHEANALNLECELIGLLTYCGTVE